MLGNILGFVVFIALAALFGWLSVRAGRSDSSFIRWGAFSVLGTFFLVFVILAIVTTMGMLKVYGSRGNPVQEVSVQSTPDQVARGEHIAGVLCASCHSTDGALPLSGGGDVWAWIPLPLGQAHAPNLTPGGPLKNWTDGEIIRAVREGAGKDERLLVVMSSQSGRNLSNADLEAVVAYLRSQPAVPNATPDSSLSLLGVILTGTGLVPAPSAPTSELSITAPPRGRTAEYGKYIADVTGCAECHGEFLDGGAGGIAPQGPGLGHLKDWTEEQFAVALRTGVTPMGNALDPEKMPWRSLGRLDDDEIGALYAYLVGLW